MFDGLFAFIVSVIASVASYYIVRGLERDDDDDKED